MLRTQGEITMRISAPGLIASLSIASASFMLIGCQDSGQSPIARVTWIRLGSVTHAFDSNQRFNELSFGRTTGGLNVTAPSSRNLAPPGHYMLFILNGNNVPSTARVIRII